jgi:hypothetical protein
MIDHGWRRRTAWVGGLGGLVFAAAMVAAQAPAIPAKVDTAAGSVTVGATKVTLSHGYVAGPTSGIYVVELTDQPIPEAALAGELRRGGGQGLLRSGKAQGLLLYVGENGFVQTAIPFVGEVRGEKMLASVGSMDAFTVKGGQVTGQHVVAADKANQGWSYTASFSATLRPIK